MNTSRPAAAVYIDGLRKGDRIALAKAITLAESTLPSDQALANEVLDAVAGHAGTRIRVGITGSPGVGKSTFIEAFGTWLADRGNRVAVLTIDPTSPLTAGSILGDKTRMQALSRHPNAFIRPSPSGNASGGVAAHTREAILLCEAAGYDYIIVETVGTGQSEIAVRNMVDFFLLLMQPGSGDELQGIKKGIVEMADAIAITKADQDPPLAKKSLRDFQHALHLARPSASGWQPRVLACSAVQGTGLSDLAALIDNFQEELSASGFLEGNRRRQRTVWMQEHFRFLLSIDPQRFQAVATLQQQLDREVSEGRISPRHAAVQLLEAYHTAIKTTS